MTYINFKKWGTLFSLGDFYEDFLRSISIVRIYLAMLPEQVLLEMEKIRLAHRLLRINKRLFDAYLRLGEQGISDQGGEDFSAGFRLQATAFYQQIEKIQKDKKQVLEQIEQVENYDLMEEIKNVA
jgi:hypothetical protein